VRTHHPARLKTFDYTGPARYFLTFCTNDRRPHFANRERVVLVLEQITRAASQEQFALLAYCFMPDHVHLLAEASSELSDCRMFIKLAKQYSAFHFARAFGERLWQRYGYERVLRNDEGTMAVVRYILENPLRAGLVARAEDYPFLGSQAYALEEILARVGDAWSTYRWTLRLIPWST
jgi:putative transposase